MPEKQRVVYTALLRKMFPYLEPIVASMMFQTTLALARYGTLETHETTLYALHHLPQGDTTRVAMPFGMQPRPVSPRVHHRMAKPKQALSPMPTGCSAPGRASAAL